MLLNSFSTELAIVLNMMFNSFNILKFSKKLSLKFTNLELNTPNSRSLARSLGDKVSQAKNGSETRMSNLYRNVKRS